MRLAISPLVNRRAVDDDRNLGRGNSRTCGAGSEPSTKPNDRGGKSHPPYLSAVTKLPSFLQLNDASNKRTLSITGLSRSIAYFMRRNNDDDPTSLGLDY